MKLQDLHEARHHAHHPIINWLHHAFTRKNASQGIYKPLEKEEFYDLQKALPKILGPQLEYTFPENPPLENMTWRVDNEHGAFYVDLQNQGRAARDHDRYRLTVSKLEDYKQQVHEARYHRNTWKQRFIDTAKKLTHTDYEKQLKANDRGSYEQALAALDNNPDIFVASDANKRDVTEWWEFKIGKQHYQVYTDNQGYKHSFAVMLGI